MPGFVIPGQARNDDARQPGMTTPGFVIPGQARNDVIVEAGITVLPIFYKMPVFCKMVLYVLNGRVD